MCLLQSAQRLTPNRDNVDSMNWLLQFPPFCQCTHTTFQRQCIYSLSAYLLWEKMQPGVCVETYPPVGTAGFILLWGVVDVSFVGIYCCVRMCASLQQNVFSPCPQVYTCPYDVNIVIRRWMAVCCVGTKGHQLSMCQKTHCSHCILSTPTSMGMWDFYQHAPFWHFKHVYLEILSQWSNHQTSVFSSAPWII